MGELDCLREESLSDGERARIRRIWLSGGDTVIRKEPVGAGAAARCRHETTILERLVGVPGVAQLARGRSAHAITLVDDDARSLAEVEVAVDEVPTLAYRLSRAVAGMHARSVVHKDLNPSNILLTPAGEPVIIDFDVATTFAEEGSAYAAPPEMIGTMRYLPPEQTGRTGLPVDHRADLYGLGATLYELVCDRPPFEREDDLELVRDILVRPAAVLADARPDVAPMLSAIVARLLEKQPDRRYQSAEGLAYDLAKVVRAPRETFALGERDFPLRLAAPSMPTGREEETAALRVALDEAIAGTGRGVLITGAAGVGKSALANTLRQYVTARGGWFVLGKPAQTGRGITMDAVLQGVRGLARLLLAESPQAVAGLRARLTESVGVGTALLAAAVPEIAALFDITGRPADDPREDQQRLRQAVAALFRAVSSGQRPIVLVIEDVQRADPGLLETVLTEPGIDGLLVVGTSRTDEPPAARWQGTVRLSNLSLEQSADLLRELLRLPAENAARLAGPVYRWAKGNPYDTLELLGALRRAGVLSVTESGWSWDDAAIKGGVSRGDVDSILSDRVPPASLETLCTLARLGGEADISVLATADGVSSELVMERLAPPLGEGLVVFGAEHVRFRNDRVREAVGADSRPEAHLPLARRLAGGHDTELLAAEQYLAAAPLVGEESELRRIAQLFFAAGEAAARIGSHGTAERFLGAADAVLVGLGLPDDDPALVAVRGRWHAALYLLGRLDEADAVYAAFARAGTDPVELSAVAVVQISSLSQRSRATEALDLGLRLLAQLGNQLPDASYGRRIPGLCADVIAWAARLDVEADLARPEITDVSVMATAKLLSRALPLSVILGEGLTSTWMLLRARDLWMQHGPSPELGATLTSIGLAIARVSGDYRTGEVIGRHVLAVCTARDYEPFTSLVRYRYAMQLVVWTGPVEHSVEQSRRAFEGLVRGGDLQMASGAYNSVLIGQLVSARSLETYLEDIEEAVAFNERTGNQFFGMVANAHRWLATTLMTQGDAPAGAAVPEPQGLAAFVDHLCRGVAAACFGEEDALYEHATKAMRLLHPLPGYPLALAHLLNVLALSWRLGGLPEPTRTAAFAQAALPGPAADGPAGGPSGSPAGPPAEPGHVDLVRQLDASAAWLAARAIDAPADFRHLSHLAEAERARARGELTAARAAYDAAIGDLTAQRPWHRAFILERAAALQDPAVGRIVLAEAVRAYRDWGATAKVARLHAEHPYLAVADAGRFAPGSSLHTSTTSLSPDVVDTMAIVRASQAISSATGLPQLHAAVDEQLSALTGAADVVLVVRGEDGRWFLPASSRQLDAERAAADGMMPLTAFQYAVRTGGLLVVEDATRDDRFARDPYVAAAPRCSLMVVPIPHGTDIPAWIVLANRQTSGLFTADRLDAVSMITGQLVVSHRNAMLYASLEARVADRTRELAEANDMLEVLSATDALTGLANRRRFDHELSTGAPPALIMIDVDFFKRYNDRYGHQAGDECLRRVSGALTESVRRTDLACRYGGEEFVIMLDGADEAVALSIAEEVRAAVQRLAIAHEDSPSGVVTISAGVAASIEDPAELLGCADGALYAAKAAGRNRVLSPAQPERGTALR